MWRLHLLLLLSCTAVPGQSQPTFHISGTVLGCGKPYPEVRIALERDPPKTAVHVKANKAGVYEADLPLGVYSVSAFKTSHPRLIRVTSPMSVVADIYLRPQPITAQPLTAIRAVEP